MVIVVATENCGSGADSARVEPVVADTCRFGRCATILANMTKIMKDPIEFDNTLKNNKPKGGGREAPAPLGAPPKAAPCCLPFGKDFLCFCAFLGPRKADFLDNFSYDRATFRPLLWTFRFSQKREGNF